MMFHATARVANMNVRIITWSGNGPVKTNGNATSATPTPANSDAISRGEPMRSPAEQALRPDPDGEQVEEEDDRVLVGGVEEVAAQRLHEPDEDPGDERAGDAA